MSLSYDKDGKISYQYTVNPDTDSEIKCCFHLLSEVGQPWVPLFKDLIEGLGLNIEYGHDGGGADIYDRVVEKRPE